jgi:BASS family bile acid:Na+ symporter
MAVLASGVFLGLLLPDLAAVAQPLFLPSVVLLMTVTLLRTDWERLVAAAQRPRRVLACVIWILIVTPMIMAAAVAAIDPRPSLAEAMVIWAASPPLISSPSLLILLGLDGALAVVGTTVATLVQPFTVAPLLFGLIGVDLDIDAYALVARLAAMNLAAIGMALGLRRAFGPDRLRRYGQHIDGLMVLVMLTFAISIMDGMLATLIDRPIDVAVFAVTVFAVNFAMQALALLAFVRTANDVRVAIAVMTGFRNIAMVVAALGDAAHPDLRLYFVVGQLPIYLLPLALRSVYRRLGRPPDAASIER